MKLFFFVIMLASSLFSSAQSETTPRWLRNPAISPDGQWIAFEYKGDLFKVPTGGGMAIPITITPDYESNPVWSHDGKSIAFASDRYGNFDVFVMPSNGGTATRLTYNSVNDVPSDFTPDDKSVIFGTLRNDIYTSVRFPLPGLFHKLYRVPVEGGRSVMVNSAGMDFATYNQDGSKIIFEDTKGYESDERKHERASVTRDIWVYDVAGKQYSQLTNFQGNDLEPVWGDGNNYYYLSEQNDNDLNVYQSSLDRHFIQDRAHSFQTQSCSRLKPFCQRHTLLYSRRRHLHACARWRTTKSKYYAQCRFCAASFKNTFCFK